MSASNRAPRQDTLNRWVNPQAVRAYADSLDRRADRIDGESWLRDLTADEDALIRDLRASATAIREAMNRADDATRRDDDRAYARLYDRPWPRRVTDPVRACRRCGVTSSEPGDMRRYTLAMPLEYVCTDRAACRACEPY